MPSTQNKRSGNARKEENDIWPLEHKAAQHETRSRSNDVTLSKKKWKRDELLSDAEQEGKCHFHKCKSDAKVKLPFDWLLKGFGPVVVIL